MAFTALVAAWSTWGLPETLPARQASSPRRRSPASSRVGLLLWLALSALMMGWLYALVGCAPYVADRALGLSASAFGAWFLMVSGGFVLGNMASASLAARVSGTRLVLTSVSLALTAVLVGVLLVWMSPGSPLVFFGAGGALAAAVGVGVPAAQAAALRSLPASVGLGSGILALAQMALGAGVTQLGAMLDHGSPFPTLALAAGLILLALVPILLVGRLHLEA